MDIREVTERLGRNEIAARVGVTYNAVTEAVRAGVFPAAWWRDLRDMGRDKGLEIPEGLFRWKNRT